ncbi:FkbM family methyltransferase [Roseomonas sp. KE2513]|uniref:FkbM family methyltransferase n=1 Tax=Roseomonas sp. KE2513 TaxID=2479202 RepID=UPI0018DF0793|nr:FkbM family methyltransferase [Roseomonas sp. KE2513]MBI0535452.1 FkbM family methyltransferase [Roseomonas sp. KE2513]
MRSVLNESGHEAIWYLTNKVMWWRRLHSPEVKRQLRIFGDRVRYQWPVLANSLSPSSVVYSFGIGTNATFELGVVAECGSRVFAFDPTPRSAEWAACQRFPPQFRFIEVGIAAKDGEIEFFAPAAEDDISYSAYREDGRSSGSVRAPVRSLRSVMSMLGHARVDLLKMDIEGGEYDVVREMARDDIRPDQLLVEFHQGFYGFTPDDTRQAVRTLQDIGYRLFWVSDRGLEYGFVSSNAGTQAA